MTKLSCKSHHIFLAWLNILIFHCQVSLCGYNINAFVTDEQGLEFDGDYKYQNCGGTKNIVYLKQFKAHPKQFTIPQNISLSVTLKILEDIPAPISVILTISRRLPFLGYTKLPCISNYGSCTLDNICTVFDKHPEGTAAHSEVCPDWVEKTGMKCKCPFAHGEYTSKDVFIPLKASSVPKWLASGDYKIMAAIENENRSIGCVKLQFRLR